MLTLACRNTISKFYTVAKVVKQLDDSIAIAI